MMTDTERKKYYESALHTFSCEARAIAELDRNLDREAFLKTVELLSETQGRIILSACGAPRPARAGLCRASTTWTAPRSF